MSVFVWYNKYTDELDLFEEIENVTALARVMLDGWVYIGEFE